MGSKQASGNTYVLADVARQRARSIAGRRQRQSSTYSRMLAWNSEAFCQLCGKSGNWRNVLLAVFSRDPANREPSEPADTVNMRPE